MRRMGNYQLYHSIFERTKERGSKQWHVKMRDGNSRKDIWKD